MPRLIPKGLLTRRQGTPFLNPILDWHPDDPFDKDWWLTQHYILQDLGPP